VRYLLAFVAGFVSTLVFHQGLIAILHKAGASPRPAYVMTPTAPLQVPAVISLAFWGGVWGALLLPVLARWSSGWPYWVAWTMVGAVAPTLVAFLVVLPLKGKPIATDPRLWIGGLLVNAAWGFGTALLLRLMRRS
jgi:hypothetical protein